MIHRLVRMKALDHGRLFGRFLVVVDATGQLHFRQRHCPHCLEQKQGEQTRYFHQVLEAKLSRRGAGHLLETEFIENADPRPTSRIAN